MKKRTHMGAKAPLVRLRNGLARFKGGISVLALATVLVATPLNVQGQDQQDQDEEGAIELSAANLVYDQISGDVTARGNVFIERNGYTLEADTVYYNELTGIVRAVGNVRIIDPDGNILLLDEVELTSNLREGFVSNVRFILSDGSRLAARDGQRMIGRQTTLNFAAFTPCQMVCVRGERVKKNPQWQLKAVRVVHDAEKRRLYYKDAFLELFGVPILYLPYLSHPDPTVERASGFLAPEIAQRRETGVALSLPYYFAISPSMDATLTPILTTKEGLVLAGQFRRRLAIGQIQFDGSGTYVDERDINNVKTGKNDFRGHFFATGEFTHSDVWRSHYQFNIASDDTYLRRYGFSKLDTLTSEFQSEGFYGRSYVSLRSLWFQGLRVEDIQGLTAYALPMIDYSFVGKPDKRGGVIRANVNALALHRSAGMDTRRLSTSSSYSIPYTNDLGQVFRLSANMRFDAYDIRDSSRPDIPVFAGIDGSKTRFLPHLTGSFRWPFIKIGATQVQTFEPIFSFVVARKGGNPPEISNEDSRTFELTDTNIFSENRFPGIDRFESGSRLNYGGKWSLQGDGMDLALMVGQSFRFNDDITIFPDGTGLSGNFSDFVGRFDIGLGDYIDFAHRFRLDKDTFRVRRNEIDIIFGNGEPFSMTVSYFQLNRNRQAEGIQDTEEIRMSVRYRVRKNWTIFGDITQNLTNGRDAIAHGIGVLYRDECIDFSLFWQRSFTQDRDIVPGSSIQFRIRLKHLG